MIRVRIFNGKTLLILVAAIVGLVLAMSLAGPRCVLLSGTDILSVSFDNLAPGRVGVFCYRDRAGQKIRFLLAKDNRGGVHTVFDACQQCYKYHKGYTYSHGYLICRLCGNRYRIEDVGRGVASCVPVKLPARLRGGKVLVKVADLEASQELF